ncbi:MAG: DNA topoisomerase I [Nanoarchaeota archaeon]|nr:DNA topoisomerase I [Nanoarchaeota archaeon]
MGYELIITEKPSAGAKIAAALADTKPKKESSNGVPYYRLTHNKKEIVVVSAVGHIYGLDQKEGLPKSKFPVFDIQWVPSHKMSKGQDYSKKYLSTIKSMAKGASEFTVATDYDIEGEVIGLNIIRYACKKKDGSRMKFSTLTKSDLVKSYENREKTLNWGQARAGETRHMMDWFFGINLSRALTKSISSIGHFKLMSTGRVQGPALKLIVDKEKEIKAFIPESYWEVHLKGKINKGKIEALHEKGKIFDKKVAEDIFENCKGEKKAVVKSVEKREFKALPPYPFDLTSLQIEAHNCIRMSPKKTLSTAQELYVAGYISYPRTSSQVLPPEIGYSKILAAISKQSEYKLLVESLLKKGNLRPNNGKKTDPAHPAIYPTGNMPVLKTPAQKNLYDLILRRFLATFGEAATRETMTVRIDCKNEIFITKGTTTIKRGWFDLYGKHVKLKEEELPKITEKDVVDVDSIDNVDKKTTPPKRYTDASIIKELEKENLGTKATRAQIVETLKDRGFIDGKPLVATELGIRTEETLEKYSPKIVDPELTRNFETEMEKIRDEKTDSKKVLEDSKNTVIEIVAEFEKHMNKIGEELYSANIETRNELANMGKCPICKEGDLALRKGRFGRFLACNKYPECKTTFSLPGSGKIESTDKFCEHCNYPIIKIINSKTQEVCFNPDCKSKKIIDKEIKKEVTDLESGKEIKKCPTCKSGELVLRKSVYGQFLGCSKYPKCRYTEKLGNNGNGHNKPESKKQSEETVIPEVI